MRYLPAEGAFFTAVRESVAEEEEEAAKANRRPATVAETAAMFGFSIPE